jgi:hypothetical protein
VFVAEQICLRAGSDPRTVAKFVFELAGGPSGVTDERANQRAGSGGVFDGRFCGKAHRPAQAFFPPPEGGKSELLTGDWPALVDRYFSQIDEVFAFQEIPDDMTGWLIEDQTERAIVLRMLRE